MQPHLHPNLAPGVGIVVPTFNHAKYLCDALASIFAQTRPVQQVVVVDDGSSDDPAAVVARFPGAELIRQDNSGLAAARNTGLARLATETALFLDADDLLTPNAVADLLRCRDEHPHCALVYGGYRKVDGELRPTGLPQFHPVGPAAYEDLLRINLIGMHGTVLYDREVLAASGGFDPTLPRCEDYDVYLRLAREHPVAFQPSIVALYRIHGENMSGDPAQMLDWALAVQARHRPPPSDASALAAYHAGQERWRAYYANAAWRQRSPGRWRTRRSMSGKAPAATVAAAARAGLRRVIPDSVARSLRRLAGRDAPPVGAVDFGSFGSARPVSGNFGFDRGTPVDRYYIQRFLQARSADIAGRVLEIGEADYSERYGTGITRQDVLHVEEGNPQATIVGDLSQPGLLPEGAFDCMVLTQTLHLIEDMPATVREIRRALAPGGVVLLTVPGVSSVDRGEWGGTWYWSLTGPAARKLFEDEFGADNVEVAVMGNVYAATAFLQGLALEEVDTDLLDDHDPAYPCIVCVRAIRNE